ncbi:sensor domain-containing diguanylate cyclase [Methylobacterium organophilum]|nr:sensor domain-containing diguanylate cyclase [Methylobacterium organophilum]
MGILVPVGIVAVCSAMLLQLRQDAWEKAEQTSRNLIQVIERDIDRNVEIIDVALQNVVENLKMYDLEDLSPKHRQRILFDRAFNAKDLNALLVLDQYGNCIYDAAGWPPRRYNNADRDYFQAHKADPSLELGISGPIMSRSVGKPVLILSRRTGMRGGDFNGIVLGSLSLSYFDRLFQNLKLGQAGTINLFLDNGTRVLRYPQHDPGPPPNFADAPNFKRFQREGRGSFVATTQSDGTERLYTFTRVGNLPLMLTVALSTREIEAEWRARALVIGLLVFTLCGIAVGLSFLVAWELKRRNAAEAELGVLSSTDALTALPNRRAFEGAFTRAWAEARRRGGSMALLAIDADHFKRFNDRHGHDGGDRVLMALARAFASCTRRPGDLVARVGGEEFVVLLPDIDAEGAALVADTVHAAVAVLAVEADGVYVGRITVSIGLAFGLPRRGGSPDDLFRLADAALYEAKATGRDRTCYAVMDEHRGGDPRPRSDPSSDPGARPARHEPAPLVA